MLNDVPFEIYDHDHNHYRQNRPIKKVYISQKKRYRVHSNSVAANLT